MMDSPGGTAAIAWRNRPGGTDRDGGVDPRRPNLVDHYQHGQYVAAALSLIPMNPGFIDTDMLRSCFGGRAGHYPSAADRAK